MKIHIKKWIYEQHQAKAGHYRFTLVWERADEDSFYLFGEQERETDKAVLFSLKYWNLNKAGRYITDAPMCNGYKVWIPKSAIIKAS